MAFPKKISELPISGVLSNTDLLVAVSNDKTTKVTVATLAASLSGSVDTNTFVTGGTLTNTDLTLQKNDGSNTSVIDLAGLSATTFSWSNPVVMAGNTSGECITALWVSTISGCSPVTIGPTIQSPGSTASGFYSNAQGLSSVASGNYSHAEGGEVNATTDYAHAEGYKTLSSGEWGSHAEGRSTQALGDGSHAEGWATIASGDYAHAEGLSTTASGSNSHAEGFTTTATGGNSHAEGSTTTAAGINSHAGGSSSVATGMTSFIHSTTSYVYGDRSAVLGGQNITGTADDTVYIPNLNIDVIPTNDNSLTQILTRDTDGTIKYRTAQSFGFTGNTSGSCIDEIWVSSISGCSPVTIGPEVIVDGELTVSSSINLENGQSITWKNNPAGVPSGVLGMNSNNTTSIKGNGGGFTILDGGGISQFSMDNGVGINSNATFEGNIGISGSTNIVGYVTTQGIKTDEILDKTGDVFLIQYVEGEDTIELGVDGSTIKTTAPLVLEDSIRIGDNVLLDSEDDDAIYLRDDDIAGNVRVPGSLLVDSNLTVTNNATVNGDALVRGNVTILGTATTIHTETLTVKDNIITLNANATGSTAPFPIDSGIDILRNSGATAVLLWEETNGYWAAGLSGDTKEILRVGDVVPFTGNTSGDCITDLHVTNIHSCSSLNINPGDEGNVYFGSSSGITIDVASERIGIGTAGITNYKLWVKEVGTHCQGKIESDGGYARLIIDSHSNNDAILQFNEANAKRWSMGVDGITDNFLITSEDIVGGPSAYSADTALYIIRNNNFVGINTISPTTQLYVSGDTTITDVLYVSSISGASPVTIGSSIQSPTSTASGLHSISYGDNNIVSGDYVIAFGTATSATTKGAHAEGSGTWAKGGASHAEGGGTIAEGSNSHAEGDATKALNTSAHAEGHKTTASGLYSHAEGNDTLASGNESHAEGWGNLASGIASHAEGGSYEGASTPTSATTDSAHAEGIGTLASGMGSHAEGFGSVANTEGAHAEGSSTASGTYSHAEGNGTTAIGANSHSEGQSTIASANMAHAEGDYTVASGNTSHAEGNDTLAGGSFSHAEGDKTIATGEASHAEGGSTSALAIRSHAEGKLSIASGAEAHAEGYRTTASGGASHAEGGDTIASGSMSHAGGNASVATGTTSFIHSMNSYVYGDRSVVLGGQNITGSTDDTVYVPNLNIGTVGSGTSLYNLGIDVSGRVISGTTGGGAGTPGGTNTDIQWNNGGAFSGTSNLTWDESITTLTVTGHLAATTKSFEIDHPTKEGKKLIYGALEGPEHGVYVRGELKDDNIISLPDHWSGLVDEDSITVQLTAIGKPCIHYVDEIKDYNVFVGCEDGLPHCYYFIQGERKDVEKLEIEK